MNRIIDSMSAITDDLAALALTAGLSDIRLAGDGLEFTVYRAKSLNTPASTTSPSGYLNATSSAMLTIRTLVGRNYSNRSSLPMAFSLRPPQPYLNHLSFLRSEADPPC